MARKYGKKNVVKVDPLAYNLALFGEGGIGKEQPISEPILSERGWVTLGSINVGDNVYGKDGKLHEVMATFPQGEKDVYLVEFSDGTNTRCGIDHLWEVTTKNQRYRNKKSNKNNKKVLSLKEIIKDYRYKDSYNKTVNKYAIPVNDPIKFKKNKIELDPYFLGLMLGDGGFNNSITFTNSEPDLLNYVKLFCDNNGYNYTERSFENHLQIRIDSSIKKLLDKYGLMGKKSRDKFIPSDYLYNSIDVRKEMLRGLLNTDGSITHTGVSICFSSYSKSLAADVSELARSLGFIVTEKEYDRYTENSSKDFDEEIEYRLTIIGDILQLNLSEKHTKKIKPRKSGEYAKCITNIKLIGKEESKCIMLAGEEHLYITKDYIVTHNSTLAFEMQEKLVGSEGYLHLNVGMESGLDALQGVVYEDVPDWTTFEEIIDDIIENKDEDYKELKMITIDTIDELERLAKKEVIRLHNIKKPKERIDSFNKAFGGFSRPNEKLEELILDSIQKLREVGVSVFIIGHTKKKTKADPVTETEYDIITAKMSNRIFTAIQTKLHILGLAVVDRSIEEDVIGKDMVGNDKITKKITNEKRVIKFRDDTFAVESKSRFAKIVPEVSFSTDNFINAITDAIKANFNSDKDLQKAKKIQDKEKEEKISKKMIEIKKQSNLKKSYGTKEEIIEKIKGFYLSTENADAKESIKEKIKELGLGKFDELIDVDYQEIINILEITKE